MSLADVSPGQNAVIQAVGGQRAFRRRLLELGLLPGTAVTLVRVAPLRDPVELLVRGTSLSIRRAEAACIEVAQLTSAASEPLASGAARGPG
ncbi:MAG: ferrous iron transport protein A [Polyangiaceae bacterium]|nr:ferrous iron transport protein A [Polyangiaceae bacterium]